MVNSVLCFSPFAIYPLAEWWIYPLSMARQGMARPRLQIVVAGSELPYPLSHVDSFKVQEPEQNLHRFFRSFHQQMCSKHCASVEFCHAYSADDRTNFSAEKQLEFV